MSHSTTPSRFRVNSPKTKDSPNSPSMEATAKSVSPNVKRESRVRRSLAVIMPKSGDCFVGSQKGGENEDARVLGRSLNRPVVEQFARPRRQRPIAKKIEEESSRKELQEKLGLKENFIRCLQSEVLTLKSELDKAHGLNKELQLQNQKLIQDLSAAEAKIAAFTNSNKMKESIGEFQSPKFKDIQKLIANKLEHSTVRKELINGPSTVKAPQLPLLPTPAVPLPPPPPPPRHTISKAANAERSGPSSPFLPPPPPPPPPMRPLAKATTAPKAPAIVEFYNSLRRQEEKRDNPGHGNQYKLATTSAHNSVVGELQNRSAHLLAIKVDVETKGDFINSLIQKVVAAAYTDMEDVVKFVDWLDSELSSLADERAVLKHFKWPERKADAMREAAIEYRNLKLLESEISSYKDDSDIPYGTSLKRMAVLLDKSEQSIQRLIKLRNSVMRSYQDLRIPNDWMLDSGIVSKIKQCSMKLAKLYTKRVIMELELARNSERECNQEALLLQGVHFAYRAHKFAGGLDSETMCALEEIRRQVPRHLGGVTQELLVAVATP